MKNAVRSLVLILSAAMPALGGGSFSPDPRSVGQHAVFEHPTFEHSNFSRPDFSSAATFNSGDSAADRAADTFGASGGVTRYDNGLDTLSVQDQEGRRFSPESQSRFSNMRMHFEDEEMRHMNFN